MNDEQKREALTVFSTFCARNCSPGAEGAEWYKQIWLAACEWALARGREEEREACAKVCDEQAMEPECPERAQYCAQAIRNRHD